MKLTDLNPTFVNSGGDGVQERDPATGAWVPAPLRRGVGVMFDCPCGNRAEDHRCYVPFRNPIDGGPSIEGRGWERTGETFETLTTQPSVLRTGGCGWHGWIRGGEVITC